MQMHTVYETVLSAKSSLALNLKKKKKKKFIWNLPYFMFLTLRSVRVFKNKNSKRVTKHQCISWRSKASRLSWKGRRWRGILSVTICRWRSRRWGLGFWFWAARIAAVDGFSLDARSCPGWRGPALAACSASCTGHLSCRTPWRRSCGSRSQSL